MVLNRSPLSTFGWGATEEQSQSKDNPMPSRKITPHKGGRTEQVGIVVTPEIKALLRKIRLLTGQSAGDLLTKAVLAERVDNDVDS